MVEAIFRPADIPCRLSGLRPLINAEERISEVYEGDMLTSQVRVTVNDNSPLAPLLEMINRGDMSAARRIAYLLHVSR